MILHLRVVPGFWIAVEEIRRPALRSHPVILGGLPHQRGVVREANFPAQRRGVRVSMSLSQAYQQCPDGIFLLPDLPQYEAVWAEICSILNGYTPLVEPLEMGQAVCDLSGCERLWGDGLEAARTIASHIHRSTGIVPWLGVASNRLVAQLASTAVGAEGIAVIDPGQERTFLADLPLTLLPGIDPRLAITFQVLGLKTIGQLAALPAASVKQRFGRVGERLHAYACGIDDRPVVPPPAKQSVIARHECEEGSIEEAAETLHTLAESCALEIQERGLAGTVVELVLEFPSPPSPLSHTYGRGGEYAPSPVGQGFSPVNRSHGSSTPQPCELPSPPPTAVPRGADTHGKTLPIPYRIHSMLPQPGTIPPKHEVASTPDTTPPKHEVVPTPDTAPLSPDQPPQLPAVAAPLSRLLAKTVVRTPLNTASQLMEVAQRLLLQHWPKDRDQRVHAITLEISQFPAPKQLAFPELNRIGQTGGLSGASAERLQALAEQEQVLAARYGDASFRHVAQVDLDNILTERRFSWSAGLPWRVP